LSTETFEALQILKSAYRNGHVAAVDQAATRVDMDVFGLDNPSDDDADIIEL
jgi:hypothetical protein